MRHSHLLACLVIIAALFSSGNCFKMVPKDQNNIEFSHDGIKLLAGLIDLTLEGKINPQDLERNTLGAVVKIFGHSFPILKSFGLTEKKLEFQEEKCFDLGFVTGCAGFKFEFYIGWVVANGTAEDYNYLNVTYVPFVRGEGGVYLSAETWILKFTSNADSKFVTIKVPISTQLNFHDDVQFCYDANSEIIDPSILATFETTVKS